MADLLTAAQAAEILDVNVATINKWAKKGRLQAAHAPEGVSRVAFRLFEREEVEKLRLERAS